MPMCKQVSSTVPQEAWQAAGLTRHAVDCEAWREYVWPDGKTYRVEAPVRLYMRKTERGDSHRVVDASGVVHYIALGWRALRWCPRAGMPEVEF